MDEDELDALNQNHPRNREVSESKGRISPRRAFLTVTVSFVFLTLLILLALSSNVGALGFGGVGGIYIQVDNAVGNNIEAYPTPTETSACYSNSSSSIVGSQDEVAAGALKIDVSQLRIPADKQLRIIKDIRTPEILDIGVVRIRIQRAGLETNPSYPPAAGLSAAEGTVPRSYLGGIEFAGIDSGTKINDGYADLTFYRTRNITSGETNINLTVNAKASYDYSEVSTRSYTFTRGRNPNRYVDDVTLQSLSNTNTGDDGGYGLYTSQNNAPDNVSAGGSPGLTVESNNQGADFTDADAARYGSPDGENNPDFQIDDVILDTISNINTGGNFGYRDYTGQTTDRLNKQSSYELTVGGVKNTTTYGWNDAPSPTSNYGANTNDGDRNAKCGGPGCVYIDDVQFEGISRTGSGDDDGYYPDPSTSQTPPPGTNVIEPGEKVEISVQARVTDGSGFGEIGDEPSVALVKAFIDWDQDGTMGPDEDSIVALGSVADGQQLFSGSTQIQVPKDAKQGSTLLRVINGVSIDDGNNPDPSYPADILTDGTAQNYEIDGMEVEDYYVDVNLRNTVVAWADWDEDGTLSSDERVDVGTSLDKSGTYNYSKFINPPDDALSGSHLLRVQQYNGRDSPNPDGDFDGYKGTTEDYTVKIQENLNSSAHAFVDWNQNGQFDLTTQEEEDFSYGSLSGWTVNGNAGTATDISNSGSYSVNVSASTGSELVSPTVSEAGSANAINVRFWIARGSDSFSENPDAGDAENIAVEYLNNAGNWIEIKRTSVDRFETGESEIISLDISSPDALHSGFQVRFSGTGANGDDYWHIDDPRISTTQEAQRVGTSTVSSGLGTYLGSLDVPADAKSGSTLMRVVHQQDGYVANYPAYSSPPGTEFDGEAEDYSLHVEPDTSFVRAWIDWNRDGDFNFDSNEEYFVGQQNFPGNEDGFTVSTTVDAPSFSGSGAAVMRVKHEQQQRQIDLTDWDVDGFRGENEDYTVILSQTPGDVSKTGNLTLGDSSLVVTNLTAENLGLTTTLIDEDYSDNTPQNPTFGPDSSFVFSGDKLELTNATGVLHQANLGAFDINGVEFSVEYNPQNPRNKTSNACPIMNYQP